MLKTSKSAKKGNESNRTGKKKKKKHIGLESKGKTPAENSENENKNVHNKEKMKGKMIAKGEPKGDLSESSQKLKEIRMSTLSELQHAQALYAMHKFTENDSDSDDSEDAKGIDNSEDESSSDADSMRSNLGSPVESMGSISAFLNSLNMSETELESIRSPLDFKSDTDETWKTMQSSASSGNSNLSDMPSSSSSSGLSSSSSSSNLNRYRLIRQLSPLAIPERAISCILSSSSESSGYSSLNVKTTSESAGSSSTGGHSGPRPSASSSSDGYKTSRLAVLRSYQDEDDQTPSSSGRSRISVSDIPAGLDLGFLDDDTPRGHKTPASAGASGSGGSKRVAMADLPSVRVQDQRPDTPTLEKGFLDRSLSRSRLILAPKLEVPNQQQQDEAGPSTPREHTQGTPIPERGFLARSRSGSRLARMSSASLPLLDIHHEDPDVDTSSPNTSIPNMQESNTFTGASQNSDDQRKENNRAKRHIAMWRNLMKAMDVNFDGKNESMNLDADETDV